jgi:cytidine deaminase
MKHEELERLIAGAEQAMKKAVAPYSDFRVGAALLAADGRIYTGCNVENPSLMLASCAERTALLKAVSEGQRDFKAMAIVSSDGRYCFPCGACRQMLMEFAPGLFVFLSSDKGIKKFTVGELLPYPFEGPKT